MAPRALGALLAIVAAIAFAVSIASSAWPSARSQHNAWRIDV
jgi:hypothetical protein